MDSKREKDQDTDFTKITSVLLKSRTGEFDLESILFLKLRGLGICDLGCIGECTNLERLDLSGNNITKLVPLSSLRLLIVLNVSANRISNLEAISSCDSLQSLNVAGNLISSIENLHCLQSLRKLENIRLKDNTYNFSNPAGLFKNGQLPELSEPWVEDGFWEIKRSNNAIIEEAYKQFNDVLHECRLLNNRAAHIISQTERSLSLKNQSKQYAV
ncbi:leucine-rich repeat-containing protein 61 isoform X3 [Hypomesus transpacificus]|uniref:leucine-rich repeat-containing protein 61 isoform X3 n=1 Tax=Hypomesus transpacificus TaxID=137520 RepID=UPI001F07F456|nr:leucine-rich repeat-containing protein 61 isoform X3 [Hypomesus transpacificus]